MLFKHSCILLLWVMSVASTKRYCQQKCGKKCDKHCVTGCLYFSHTCFCNSLAYVNPDTKECFIPSIIAVVFGNNSIIFPHSNGSTKHLQLANQHSGKISAKTIIAKDFLHNSVLFTTFKTIEDSRVATNFRYFNVANWGSLKLNADAGHSVASKITSASYCSSMSTLYLIEDNKIVYRISSFLNSNYTKSVLAEIEGASYLAVDCCLGYLFVTSLLTPKIYRIDVDRYKVKRNEIISTKVIVEAITIDRMNGEIYWVEQDEHYQRFKLLHSDYDGTNIQLLTSVQQSPFDIVYLDTFLYWTSPEDKAVFKTNTLNGNTSIFFEGMEKVYALAVAGSTRYSCQRRHENCHSFCKQVCSNHCAIKCDMDAGVHTCRCNALSALNKDATDCTFPEQLLYTDGYSLTFVLNDTEIYNITIPYRFPVTRIVRTESSRILLTLADYSKRTLFAMFDMKTLSFRIIAAVPGEVYDVTYGPTNDTIYLTCDNGKIMEIRNVFDQQSLENQQTSDLLQHTGAYGIVNDDCHGYLFVTNVMRHQVDRLTISTGDVKHIGTVHIKQMHSITIDTVQEKVYWIDVLNGEDGTKYVIKESNYDGSLQKPLYEQSSSNVRLLSIAFARSKMYMLLSKDNNMQLMYHVDALGEHGSVSVRHHHQISVNVVKDFCYFHNAKIDQAIGHWSDWSPCLSKCDGVSDPHFIRYCQKNTTSSVTCSTGKSTSNVQWKCFSSLFRDYVQEGSNETRTIPSGAISECEKLRKEHRQDSITWVVILSLCLAIGVLTILVLATYTRKRRCCHNCHGNNFSFRSRLRFSMPVCLSSVFSTFRCSWWYKEESLSMVFVTSRGKEPLIEDDVSLTDTCS